LEKRERRRYLTHKYQQKQVRLANTSRNYRSYDSERYFQRPLAKKQRFLDVLAENYVGREWNDISRGYRTERELKTEYMLGHDTEGFTPEQLGRLRNHSFDDCGRPRCHMCGNPRRGNGWWKEERITIQERINKVRFKDDLQYYYQYEEKLR
jgi:hypothetical protein